jgi:hypothetical protein
MQVCGRQFSPDIINRISATVESEPGLSRRALSFRVCEWLDWRAANGRFQDVSCRKALLELHRRSLIRLPAVEQGCFRARSPEQPTDPMVDGPRLSCRLQELGAVSIQMVSSRYCKASRIWNGLMERFHYLGKGPLCGAQIRYLVQSERHGFLGALAFSSATWRLKERDQYIGWTEAARRANLDRVVCNSRFLILPQVHVTNLASRVLSLCMDRLANDWMGRYGYAPVLAETFVDPSRYVGTCYRAANWVYVGKSAARPTAYRNGKVSEGAKDIYVCPIRADWQQVLCAEPQVALGETARLSGVSDWTEEEFGAVRFFDERLKKRLYRLAADFFAQPGELVPQACNGEPAKTRAAYRFFKNPVVDMQTLLRPHIESSIDRIKSHPVILAVQDTSTLNYTSHPPVGVGPVNTTKDKTVGLLMHDTMAFTPEGVPLGLLNVQCWARDPQQAGRTQLPRELPIEEKESFKWLASYRAVAEIQKICSDTMLVSVGDREADIYDLFHEALQNAEHPKLLVRAERSRKRKADQQPLWPKMSAEALAGTIQLAVPGKGSRPARTATIQVRYAEVMLSPPKDSTFEPVRVWAIYARETHPGPQVKEPIDWMLLSTVKTETLEQACERLVWYSRRWGIEVYHRTVKSGCRIQDRRLEHTENLQACLAIDLVVAWRIYWLTVASRKQPDAGCDQTFREEEWRVLSAWATGKAANKPPGAQQMIRWIGKLGGWLARGKDDNPGTTCLWRGLLRLPSLAQGYLLALQIHNINNDP